MKPLANFQRLSISTILAQLLVTFSIMLWMSIQEELWHPIVVQPVVYFSNITDFLLSGVLRITCLAAIGEELFFRHILEKCLYAITRRKLLSTIIISLLFTLIHRNIPYSPMYFTLGCFFSYLYQKSGHIVYSIMAHAINNLCVVSIIYLGLNGSIESAIKSLPIIVRSIVAIESLLAACFCITYGYSIIDKNHKN
ncbi:CPBP family intramembrane glutamic endopeptidase [Candidatus Cardinium hertigii]|nr:CPBP family intramembrane glutamic endopeptidase [Candidatus Cardinium hertigii]